MQGHGERDGEQAGRVTRDPVGHGRGRGERSARRETQAAVPFDVGIVGQQSRREPPGAADERGHGDVHPPRVEPIRAVRERDGHDEADAPRRDGEELGVDRSVP